MTLKLTPEGLVAADPQAIERAARMAELDDDSCCSFEEWRASGYMIKKGEKSVFRDVLGIPQFTKEQVTRRRP